MLLSDETTVDLAEIKHLTSVFMSEIGAKSFCDVTVAENEARLRGKLLEIGLLFPGTATPQSETEDLPCMAKGHRELRVEVTGPDGEALAEHDAILAALLYYLTEKTDPIHVQWLSEETRLTKEAFLRMFAPEDADDKVQVRRPRISASARTPRPAPSATTLAKGHVTQPSRSKVIPKRPCAQGQLRKRRESDSLRAAFTNLSNTQLATQRALAKSRSNVPERDSWLANVHQSLLRSRVRLSEATHLRAAMVGVLAIGIIGQPQIASALHTAASVLK
ncbi:hypothetical protein KX928_12005 [Roseobacter sp. YSTF-M11]|uniref:Uncharacterized protein n=1 Tax=Roseobacter insulae TaxID=2859783 RepID=A0A9X1K3D3_9RHOB|nr:hypothetical protein [Roseobacter insulae]MBW4708507.1 hypothetical protein [Roseobacter insulae]